MYEDRHLEASFEDRFPDLVYGEDYDPEDFEELDESDDEPVFCEECCEYFADWDGLNTHYCVPSW